MSFNRHREIYPSDEDASMTSVLAHRLDEFPAGYSLAGCAPALPASASPTDFEYALKSSCRSIVFHRAVSSVLTVHEGLRPEKIHEKGAELRRIGGWSGEVEQTVGKSRLINCLIRSMRD